MNKLIKQEPYNDDELLYDYVVNTNGLSLDHMYSSGVYKREIQKSIGYSCYRIKYHFNEIVKILKSISDR